MFQRLPASIQELKKLRILDLEENHLDCLPNEIGELIHNLSQEQAHVNFSLFHLNLLSGFNYEKAYKAFLFFFIGNLAELQRLVVQSNHLQVLPPSIG